MATRRPTESSPSPAGTEGAPATPEKRTRARSTPRKKATATPVAARVEISPETRHSMIAEAAYLRSERRGFVPGYELEDWLSAEAEVDALLRAEPSAAQ